MSDTSVAIDKDQKSGWPLGKPGERVTRDNEGEVRRRRRWRGEEEEGGRG